MITLLFLIWNQSPVHGAFLLFSFKVQAEVVASEAEEQEAHVRGRLTEPKPVGIHGVLGSISHSQGQEELEEDRVSQHLQN